MGIGHLSILMLSLPCNVEFELAVHHPPAGDRAGTTLFQQVKVVINPGLGKRKMISPHTWKKFSVIVLGGGTDIYCPQDGEGANEHAGLEILAKFV